MKNSSIAGWKDVYSFTFIQTLKSKAYIVSFFILMALILISMPAISYFTSNKTLNTDEISPIKKVYIDNQTTFTNLDLSGLTTNANLNHIIFAPLQEDYKIVEERIENNENTSVILTVTDLEGMYSFHFVRASDGPIKNSSLQIFSTAVVEQFEKFRLEALDVTEEQAELLNTDVRTEVSTLDASGNVVMVENAAIKMSEYWFMYGILVFVTMVTMIGSSQVASSIVTEKSTRVVEYLLISVRPLALIMGKVFAMLSLALIQMISLIIAAIISNTISSSINNTGTSLISQYLPDNILQSLSFTNITLCLIFVVLGILFYATLAGLAGATVSRLEELSEGMALYSFVVMAGMYVGLGACAVLLSKGINAYVTFSFLFPLSAPFLLPGAILIGKVDMLIMIIALLLQIVSITLLFKFIAKVYETLILYNGNKIKLNQLIKMAKKA